MVVVVWQSVGHKVTKTESLEEGHMDASKEDKECWTGCQGRSAAGLR